MKEITALYNTVFIAYMDVMWPLLDVYMFLCGVFITLEE